MAARNHTSCVAGINLRDTLSPLISNELLGGGGWRNNMGDGACFSFKVFPKKKDKFFFEVRVFHSKRQMYAYYQSHPSPYKEVLDFTAINIPVTTYKIAGRRMNMQPNLGEILFHRPQTGSGIVSHEMTHAALHWARVTKQSLSLTKAGTDEEEVIALAIGNLTRQFMAKY
jgi:hypothetical protein